MSNEAKMTFEEKVVQALKQDKLFTFLDEDALHALVLRAVNEALIQPRRVEKQYGGYDHADSPAVAAARHAATTAAETVARAVATQLSADPAFQKDLLEAFAATIPDAIRNAAMGMIHTIQSNAAIEATGRLAEGIRTRSINLSPQ